MVPSQISQVMLDRSVPRCLVSTLVHELKKIDILRPQMLLQDLKVTGPNKHYGVRFITFCQYGHIFVGKRHFFQLKLKLVR